MKKCPYCAELIQDEAIKCRFCGEKLPDIKKILESKCPYCGVGYKYDDEDRRKGENTCANCGKTYKLENSKNIKFNEINVEGKKPIELNNTKKKTSCSTWLGLILIIFICVVFFQISSNVSNPSTSNTKTQKTNTPTVIFTPTPTKTPEEIAQMEAAAAAQAAAAAEAERLRLIQEEADFKANCPSIDYKILDKDSSPYYGQKVYYKGQIVQVGTEYGSEWYRISITDMGYGYYTDTLWVTYPGTTSFVQDDVVKFWGTIDIEHCYTSQANWEICIPAVKAKYIEK